MKRHRSTLTDAVALLAAFLALVLAISLTGCTLTAPVAVTAEPLNNCPLRGEASTNSVAGLVHWGNGSVAAAAQAAGIRTVCTVDVRRTFILGPLYVREVTIVTGKP